MKSELFEDGFTYVPSIESLPECCQEHASPIDFGRWALSEQARTIKCCCSKCRHIFTITQWNNKKMNIRSAPGRVETRSKKRRYFRIDPTCSGHINVGEVVDGVAEGGRNYAVLVREVYPDDPCDLDELLRAVREVLKDQSIENFEWLNDVVEMTELASHTEKLKRSSEYVLRPPMESVVGGKLELQNQEVFAEHAKVLANELLKQIREKKQETTC